MPDVGMIRKLMVMLDPKLPAKQKHVQQVVRSGQQSVFLTMKKGYRANERTYLIQVLKRTMERQPKDAPNKDKF